MLFHNYTMPYVPATVNWIADVMDTSTQFRNIQPMPFMLWSREISDYIYKEYMLSDGQLYKLTPQLLEEPCSNDSVKTYMTRLLNNFKIINSYVCDNNKIYLPAPNDMHAEKELLLSFTDSLTKNIFTMSDDTSLMSDFVIPKKYKYLYVEVSADVNLSSPKTEDQPAFRLAMVSKTPTDRNYLYWSNRDIVLMTKGDYVPQQWNHVSTNDMFTLDDYRNYSNMIFNLAIYNDTVPLKLKIKQLKVAIYGIQ